MVVLIQGLTSHLNQEVARSALSDRGDECLQLMTTYDSIGQWTTVREDQSLTT
jgi:hypothetical protein